MTMAKLLIKLIVCVVTAASLAAFPAAAQELLVPHGAKGVWQYLDAGKSAGKDWTLRSYDDTNWKSGAAPLGYGDLLTATEVFYGIDPNAKAITTYFRHAVEMADPGKVGALMIDLRRDSGGKVDQAEPKLFAQVREDHIGYLRIPQMGYGDGYIAALDDSMQKFQGTRGLIIDVRGNSGGTQDTIRTILPWLMKPGSAMKIINVAAYRLPFPLPQTYPSGFLGLDGRGLHPATSQVWSIAQAAHIRAFLATWNPSWKPPTGKFSDWHVMAIAPHPQGRYYAQPVIVLQNEEDFSATDNFLGALKGHPNMTLMGTTSGGGSGRMADYILPNSQIRLTLCQMASFASNGMLYEGNGVVPDVVLQPVLRDLLGRGDTVLEAAVARLLR